MKDKAVVILKLMTTLVLILIGVGIWLFLNKEEKEQPTTEPEIPKEEALDMNSDIVKNLPFPDMKEGCNLVEMIGRYNETTLKREDIELSEKIDTAYKKLSTNGQETVSAEEMKQYTVTYWGEIDDYYDFSFSVSDTNYTYDEEENVYHIETLDLVEQCEESSYMKRYLPVMLSATKKEKEIIVDYAIVYYIEDASEGNSVIYHVYQDIGFTNYIESVKETGNDLSKVASKYNSKLEHYTFTFKEENGSYYFVEGTKSNIADSLTELELTEENLENISMLSLDDLCLEFTEDSIYQKEHFSLESISVKDQLWLSFYHAYQKQLITKEAITTDRIEYVFTEEEVNDIYQGFWGEELKAELENFEQFGYQGILENNQYRFIISSKENVCPTTSRYVEKQLGKAYEKDNIIYLDYKIRFIDKDGNNISIYQNKNYETALETNIRKSDISEEYWDLNYVTYRYVFKKQENGKYYFLEGFYI